MKVNISQHEAYRRLGLDPSASWDEVCRRHRLLGKKFHPDNPKTGDNEAFLSIEEGFDAIFATVHAQASCTNGKGQTKASATERQYQASKKEALGFDVEVADYLEAAHKQYSGQLASLKARTLGVLWEQIDATRSVSDLKNATKTGGPIALYMTEITSEATELIKSAAKAIGLEDSKIVKRHFAPKYTEYRRQWLHNLVLNPAVIVNSASGALIYFAHHYGDARHAGPVVMELLTLWWIPFIVLALVLTYQYHLLGPQNQYVPPRLSPITINPLLKQVSDTVGYTGNVGAAWGSAIGAAASAGTAAATGVAAALDACGFCGTATLALGLFGAIVGAGVGSKATTNMAEEKQSAYQHFKRHLDIAFSDIQGAFDTWCAQNSNVMEEEAVRNFEENLRRETDPARRFLLGLPPRQSPKYLMIESVK